MTQEGKFGVTEMIFLVLISSLAKVFCTCPQMDMKILGTSSWYMIALSALVAAAGFSFCYLLLKRFPGRNLLQIYDAVSGRFLGSIFSFLLAVVLLSTVVVNLREFTDIMRIYAFKESPSAFIMTLVLLAVANLSFLGLEAIVRYIKFVGYILLFGIVVGLLLSLENYDVYRLFPIFGHGVKATLISSVERSYGYGEVLFVGIFAGSLQGIRYIKKAGFLSLLFSGVLVALIYLSFNLTFTYSVGEELAAPVYVQSTLIEYGSFLQRLEPLFYYVWIITTVISLTAMFYAALFIYCYIFRLRDKKPLIIPLAVITFYLSLAPDSLLTVTSIHEKILRTYAWIIFFIPPVISLIVAKLRKKGGTANA